VEVFIGHRRGRRGAHDKFGCCLSQTCDAIMVVLWCGGQDAGVTPG
jgi:hypothetical protein